MKPQSPKKTTRRSLPSNGEIYGIKKLKVNNLVVVNINIHEKNDASESYDANACFRCGRTSHWVEDCYAKTDCYGNRL